MDKTSSSLSSPFLSSSRSVLETAHTTPNTKLELTKNGFLLTGLPDGEKPDGFEQTAAGFVCRSPVAAFPYAHIAQNRTEIAIRALKNVFVSSWSVSPKNSLKTHPRGFSYFPYQEAGIEFMKEHKRCLNADEPGTGKTIQVAGLINETNVQRVLILCPASLRLNWGQELEKWVFRKLQHVEIISYDSAWRGRVFKELRDNNFDLVVMDEAHYLKNGDSKRSMAAQALAAQADRVVLLTGTPVMNRPKDLFIILRIINKNMFPDFQSFALRYCGAFLQTIRMRGREKKVWNNEGSSHEKELGEILRSTIMIRRCKKDVLPQLPHKLRQVIEVPSNLQSCKKEQEKWNQACSEVGYDQALRQLENGVGVAFEKMASARQQVAIDKVPFVIEHVTNMLEGGKVVVFAHHRSVVDALMVGLQSYSPVRYVGGMTDKSKYESVRSFQDDEQCRVFIGNIQAAGVGITLTAASTVVFAELGLVPSVMCQAEDRCCRIGATAESILVQHIVLNGSLDVKLARMLVKKQEVADMILDI